MHETIIAKEIIDEAKKHGNVKSIVVEVGDLAHLPADDMRRTLKEMVPWNVSVVRRSAIVKCVCGYKGIPRIREHGHDFCLFDCPKCKALPEVLDGKDIVLKKVVVD